MCWNFNDISSFIIVNLQLNQESINTRLWGRQLEIGNRKKRRTRKAPKNITTNVIQHPLQTEMKKQLLHQLVQVKKLTQKTRSSPRKKVKVKYKSLHEGNSDFEDEEIELKKRCKKNGKKEKKIVCVQFEEDGNVIEMEAEEMDTDIMSGEENENGSSAEEELDSIIDESSHEDLGSKNNNASMVTNKASSR